MCTTLPRDPFKVLGVPRSSTTDELKKAHRELAKKFHPDHPGGSKERFQEVQEAYERALQPGAATARYAEDGVAARGQHDPTGGPPVYDTPGSTQENYFSGRHRKYQTMARLALVWCCVFVVVRSVLFFALTKPHQPESRVLTPAPPVAAAGSDQSHTEQQTEVVDRAALDTTVFGLQGSDRDPLSDPLRRY